MRFLLGLLLYGLVTPIAASAQQDTDAQRNSVVQLFLDTSEAEQCLKILHKENAHQTITPDDWQALFATIPYQWLKQREAAMQRTFTDEEFKRFLLSPASLARQEEWEQTLAAMKQTDMTALGTAVLAWLPAGSSIHTRVFPEIKPITNSFVWSSEGQGPAIFLYLQQQTTAQFENTVAHECHHIGIQSLAKRQEEIQRGMPANMKTAFEWMGGFAEGEAMLAAVGSTDKHPHWEKDALARARWDGDMMHFNQDVATLQQFFTDILDGKLQGSAAIRQRASPFWGEAQGAWYTVGYEMAVLVEKQYGRQTFTECLVDPRKLLKLYNRVALEANAKGATLATWSAEFLERLNGSQ